MKGYSVKSIDSYECKDWLLNKHYAKRLCNIIYSFGLFKKNELVGICTLGMPPTPFLSKIFVKGTYLELNRLVTNDKLDKNALSFFVGYVLKNIGNYCIVSYADPNAGHHGYIYQATNWIYTGKGRVNQNDKRGVNKFFYHGKEYHERHIPETMVSLKFIVDKEKTKNSNWLSNGGQIISQKRKHRYFYVCGSKKFKKKNKKIIQKHFDIYQYPKGKNQRYDASYKPTTQAKLF
tara:strand:+ start:95 stop:796 length:702 start_codon:yes stop_codon:yes gene_type:complete